MLLERNTLATGFFASHDGAEKSCVVCACEQSGRVTEGGKFGSNRVKISDDNSRPHVPNPTGPNYVLLAAITCENRLLSLAGSVCEYLGLRAEGYRPIARAVRVSHLIIHQRINGEGACGLIWNIIQL